MEKNEQIKESVYPSYYDLPEEISTYEKKLKEKKKSVTWIAIVVVILGLAVSIMIIRWAFGNGKPILGIFFIVIGLGITFGAPRDIIEKYGDTTRSEMLRNKINKFSKFVDLGKYSTYPPTQEIYKKDYIDKVPGGKIEMNRVLCLGIEQRLFSSANELHSYLATTPQLKKDKEGKITYKDFDCFTLENQIKDASMKATDAFATDSGLSEYQFVEVTRSSNKDIKEGTYIFAFDNNNNLLLLQPPYIMYQNIKDETKIIYDRNKEKSPIIIEKSFIRDFQLFGSVLMESSVSSEGVLNSKPGLTKTVISEFLFGTAYTIMKNLNRAGISTKHSIRDMRLVQLVLNDRSDIELKGVSIYYEFNRRFGSVKNKEQTNFDKKDNFKPRKINMFRFEEIIRRYNTGFFKESLYGEWKPVISKIELNDTEKIESIYFYYYSKQTNLFVVVKTTERYHFSNYYEYQTRGLSDYLYYMAKLNCQNDSYLNFDSELFKKKSITCVEDGQFKPFYDTFTFINNSINDLSQNMKYEIVTNQSENNLSKFSNMKSLNILIDLRGKLFAQSKSFGKNEINVICQDIIQCNFSNSEFIINSLTSPISGMNKLTINDKNLVILDSMIDQIHLASIDAASSLANKFLGTNFTFVEVPRATIVGINSGYYAYKIEEEHLYLFKLPIKVIQSGTLNNYSDKVVFDKNIISDIKKIKLIDIKDYELLGSELMKSSVYSTNEPVKIGKTMFNEIIFGQAYAMLKGQGANKIATSHAIEDTRTVQVVLIDGTDIELNGIMIYKDLNRLIKKDKPRLESVPETSKSYITELKELKELLDLDIITKEEFEAKKKKILSIDQLNRHT